MLAKAISPGLGDGGHRTVWSLRAGAVLFCSSARAQCRAQGLARGGSLKIFVWRTRGCRALKSLELWTTDLCTVANVSRECLFDHFQVPLPLNTATWQVRGSRSDVSRSLKGRVPASRPLLALFWWECECDGWRWRPSSWGSPVLRTGYRRPGSWDLDAWEIPD